MRTTLALIALLVTLSSMSHSARAEEQPEQPAIPPLGSEFEVPSGPLSDTPSPVPTTPPPPSNETAPVAPAAPSTTVKSEPEPTAPIAAPVAEAPKVEPRPKRNIVVTATTDTSSYGFGRQVQYALSRMYEDSKSFGVKMSGFSFAGFSEADIARAFDSLSTRVASFAYLENERIAVFLFDADRPKEFIAVSETLAVTDDLNVMQGRIDDKLASAFRQVLAAYNASNYQPLPGVQIDTEAVRTEEQQEKERRAIEARSLFRELSLMQDTNFYIGANLGMARFTANNASGSTINLSAFAGGNLSQNWRAEGGISCFSYAMLFGDARYLLPFKTKYIQLGLSAGLATILGSVSPSDNFNPENFKPLTLLGGPGLSLIVPVVGAYLRGEIKFYLGPAGRSIVMGTYGVSYSL